MFLSSLKTKNKFSQLFLGIKIFLAGCHLWSCWHAPPSANCGWCIWGFISNFIFGNVWFSLWAVKFLTTTPKDVQCLKACWWTYTNGWSINKLQQFENHFFNGHLQAYASPFCPLQDDFEVKIYFALSVTSWRHDKVSNKFTRQKFDTLSGSPEHSHLCPTHVDCSVILVT